MPRGAKRANPKTTSAAKRAPRPSLGQRLAEALAQQAATGEILRVIRSSPGDVQPVFDAIVASAGRLCEAEFAAVARFDDGRLHLAALNNMSPAETKAFHALFPRPAERGFAMGRALVDGRVVHIEDVLADPEYDRQTQKTLLRAARYRTFMAVPIVRDGVPIGSLGCARRVVQPFTPAQIELVKTFADQAVIAIENVRLFTEAQAQNRGLTESLEQQTATSEILRVISSSPTDVQPVFDTIVQNVVRLCEGLHAAVFRFDGDLVHLAAHHNIAPTALPEFERVYPLPPSRESLSARAILDRSVVHVPDVERDAEAASSRRLGLATGFRSVRPSRCSATASPSGRSASGAPRPDRSRAGRSSSSRPSPTRR